MHAWWENEYQEYIPGYLTVSAHNITLYAIWGCNQILTAEELIDFSKIVNKGTNYGGKTVFLGDDIVFTDDLSKKFAPIGLSNNINFIGTFDGLGYRISGLTVQYNLIENVGIFGYSEGAIIRNLVIDSSCSIIGTYGYNNTKDKESLFGSVIGCCETYKNRCVIENNVNMAKVSYTGNTQSNVFIGGIVGYLTSLSGYETVVRNCINYGTVVHYGAHAIYTELGGIVSGSCGEKNTVLIQNCLNYGQLRHDGVSKYPYFGGIICYSQDNIITENCVNSGSIISTTGMLTGYIGAIGGDIFSSNFSQCYWDKSIYNKGFGIIDKSSTKNIIYFDNASFELNGTVSVGDYMGTSLLDALNSYVNASLACNLSRWVINKERNSVTFEIINRTSPFLVLSSQIILLPDIAERRGLEFYGWYIDPDCTILFSETTINQNITLYGTIYEFIEEDSSRSSHNSDSSSTGEEYLLALAFIIIVVTSIVFAIVCFVVVTCNKVKHMMHANREMQDIVEPLLFDVLTNSLDEMASLYPKNYERPSLKKALMHAGIEFWKANEIAADCYAHADNLKEQDKLPKGVTVDDAAAIALYTMEIKTLPQSPYNMINDALMKGDLESLEPVKDLLYIVMCALRKMPIVHGMPLYRGICSDVLSQGNTDKAELLQDMGKKNDRSSSNSSSSSSSSNSSKSSSSSCSDGLDWQSQYGRGGDPFGNDYIEGEEIDWFALSSTSPNVAVTKEFLARGSTSGKAEGTLFIIEGGWGYNVQSCSMYPKEEEIVLEPERRFKVKSIIPGEKLTIIKMEMLKTPLVLPDVFGKKVFKLF